VSRIGSGTRLATLLATAVAVSQLTGCGTGGFDGPLQNLRYAGGRQFAIAYGLFQNRDGLP
jgi:hypothetical protein